MSNTYASSNSDDQAFYQAYCKYFGHDGMKIDPVGAFPIAKELAQKNMPGAMALLGVMFFEGKATKKDIVQARYWLERGAVAGDSWAQRILGQHMLKEDAIFGENIWLSLYWLEKAAAQKDPVACWWVGETYSKDDRIPHDLKKAIYWYDQGAELGDVDCQVEGGIKHAHLAMENPDSVDAEDHREYAYYLMERAAKQGNISAQYNLGLFCRAGFGLIEKDYREACLWLDAAVKQGHKNALEVIKEIQAETLNNYKFIYSHDLKRALRSLVNQGGDDSPTIPPDGVDTACNYAPAASNAERLSPEAIVEKLKGAGLEQMVSAINAFHYYGDYNFGQKLQSVQKSYFQETLDVDEAVLVIVDPTQYKTSREGFVITTKRIIFKSSWVKKSTLLSDIIEFAADREWITIIYRKDDGRDTINMMMAKTHEKATAFCQKLNQILLEI